MNKYFTILTLLFIVISFSKNTLAQAVSEDTLVVQTFTYQSPQDAYFNFPSDTNEYRKILLMYNLHCPDPSPCGEWDYLTYTFLYDHTGVLDSTLLNNSNFTVDGNAVDSVSYMNTPSFTYISNEQYAATIDSISNSNSYPLGAGTASSSYPYNSHNPTTKTLYIWKASELTAAGLAAGNINSFSFNLNSTGSELKYLKIRIANTVLDSFTNGNISATWSEVYSQNTIFATTGINNLLFTQPYLWNGTSNLLVEISYSNSNGGTDNIISSTPETWSAGITSTGNDRDIKFNGNEFIIVPKQAFADIDSFVSIAYWAFGDVMSQPNNGTSFEGVAANGQRILNTHCPWSDLNVYWDAGSDGSNYDRINKLATTAQTEGQWNYWTFTKNVSTGSMKIYLNGVLWHSVNGKIKLMSGIEYFRIGRGNWNGSESFKGSLDEFAVWNVELDAATIQQYMYKDIDASHPYFSNLSCYYNFNNNINNTFADGSTGNNTAVIMSSIDNKLLPAQTLFRNFVKLYERPNIVFQQADIVLQLDTIIVIDTVENAPFTIVLYADSLNATTATDTITVWSNNNYAVDVNGVSTATLLNPDMTLQKQIWYYYSDPFEIVDRYELGRFITLYGNNTTLGPNGRTWVYDLTDLAPLLHDSVHLSAGNWQEWLNMKFLMIKGKPARKPISVQNLWNGYPVWHDSNVENVLKPIGVQLSPLAKNTMWRTITTGHGGLCNEFCLHNQYGKVNGVNRFQQLIWRDDCARNPLYPQGGTWVYQRANWCPGAEVKEYNWELTPFVTPGDSVTLDLDLDAYSGSNGGANYVIASQIISFEQPNFTTDAEMYDILTPSNKDEWSRINPICSEPIVRIRNGGTTNLTSAIITYGIEGGFVYTYNWSGNLGFLKTQDVVLPAIWWVGDGSNEFYATISSPNSSTDQNLVNNTATTKYNSPALYDLSSSAEQKFIVEVKTNSFGSETSYQLISTSGGVVVNKNNLANNTIYRDTIDINPYDCYTFKIFDSGEDGLNFWANQNQGSGYSRIKRYAGTLIKSFPNDFGSEYIHNFKVNFALGTSQISKQESSVVLYPNPAVEEINISTTFTKSSENIEAVLLDLTGRELMKQTLPYDIYAEFNFNINDLSQGLYIVKVKSGTAEFVQKFQKMKY